VERAAERPHRTDRPGRLAVDFPEAQVSLDGVAVERQETVDRAVRRAGRRRVEALAAWIPVVPKAEVERDRTDGRTNAAVEVDLSRGAVRERDALARDTGIKLEVRIDIVTRLEIRSDRTLVVRLRNAAEIVIRHEGRAEREVPRGRRRRRRQ